MYLWSYISEIAQRILGTDVQPVNILDVVADQHSGQTDNNLQTNKSNQIEILPEYEFVLTAIENKCPAIFVTGRAGTGKSTLIGFLAEKLQNCALVAPTALAALNIHGATIHSFFSLPPRVLNPDEVFQPKRQIIPVIERLNALIIDEVSMVTPDLIDCISNCLKKAKGNNQPFGGVPVIFVGDLLQLPPVISNKEVAVFFTHRYGSPNFFSADVFRETPIISLELTKVFRQTDYEFVNLLDRIRLNQNHREAVAHFNRNCYLNRQSISDTALYLVPTKAAARMINIDNLQNIVGTNHQFDAIIQGNIKVENNNFPAPYRLNIKIGAQILFVKNNKPYWLNGSLGRICDIKDDYLTIELSQTGNRVTVNREVWEKIEYEYDYNTRRIITKVVGSFQQFPITLGWAITIHKSQGMSLDAVRINLGNGAFCTGQTYVALSRCRSIEGIWLDQPISMRDVKADARILEFYQKLKPVRYQP